MLRHDPLESEPAHHDDEEEHQGRNQPSACRPFADHDIRPQVEAMTLVSVERVCKGLPGAARFTPVSSRDGAIGTGSFASPRCKASSVFVSSSSKVLKNVLTVAASNDRDQYGYFSQ
jgi:hypothetical protein